MTTRPVTLLDVLGAAQAGQVALAPETAGYLTLGVADALAATPRAPEATDVVLSEDGAVEVLAGGSASPRAAEMAARSMLSQLLGVAGNRAPALSAAAKKRANEGPAHFVVELEAALIPVNRAAARRTLARLFRETARVRGDAAEIPYTPPRSTESLGTKPHAGDDAEDDFGPLEQDASIVIGELSMPITADFDPSVPIPNRKSPAAGARPVSTATGSNPASVRPAAAEPEDAPFGADEDESRGPPGRDLRPRRPRAQSRGGTYFLAGLVFLGLSVLGWLYLQHPEFFVGHR
jgi:hypothetical protein